MGGGQPSSLHFRASIEPRDIVRAAKITTPQFGSNWKIINSQEVATIRTSCKTPDQIKKRMETANFQVVEIIKQEIICAAQLRSMANANQVVPLLLHILLGNG